MNKILNRDEFGIEITKYRKGEEINEGLFQFLKSFLKEDWANIKSKNSAIKNKLEEIDRGLDSYTLVKRSNFDACNQYRQALCDFANAVFDQKMDELEKEKESLKKVVGNEYDDDFENDYTPTNKNILSLMGKKGCKDKAMEEKISDAADAISDVLSKNSAIKPWATALKRGIMNVINDAVIASAEAPDEDEKKKFEKEKEDIENKIKDDEKEVKQKLDKENKEKQAEQDKEIKALEKQRQDGLKAAGVTDILKGMDGTKATTQLKGEYDKLVKPLISSKPDSDSTSKTSSTSERIIYNNPNLEYITEGHQKIEKLVKYFESDKHFGFPKIIEVLSDDNSVDFATIAKNNYKKKDKESDEDFASRIKKKVINIYFQELNVLYGGIDEFNKGDVLKAVPCDAIQAMFSGLALGVGYGLVGDSDKKKFFTNDANIEIMARCCIATDATVGYSFPLVDEKKPDDGTVFVYLLGQLSNEENKHGVFSKKSDTKLLNSFKENMKKLYDMIKKKAEDLKKEADEENEKKAKEADTKEKAEEDKK